MKNLQNSPSSIRAEIRASGLDLGHANLTGAMAHQAHLTNCRFERTTLDDADLSRSTLRLCNFDGAQAPRATLDGACLEDSTAVGSDFSRATFRNAHLTETCFSRAVLRETILDNAEGDGIDFRGADLRSASLKGVSFDEADFRGADLRDADLSGGRFHSADFRGALLQGARFDDADCIGATFDHGEGPDHSAPATPESAEASDSAAVHTLNEFLALLPDAISGAQPDAVMNRVQELLDKTTNSAGYSPEQQRAVSDLLSKLTKTGGLDTTCLQQMITTLNSDSNEPPEELKAWLETFMKAMQKDRKP